MPPTSDEAIYCVRGLMRGTLAPDWMEGMEWEDGTTCTEQDLSDMLALVRYQTMLDRKRKPVAQRKAMRHLKQFLTPEQRRQVRTCHYFHVTTPTGNVYRIYPAQGLTRAVKRHGKRYFEYGSYCLHPMVMECDEMPAADLALGHLLLLTCDEEEFLREANVTYRKSDLWDGEHLRRCRRRERQGA